MAVRTAVLAEVPVAGSGDPGWVVTWSGLTKTTDDTGEPVGLPDHPDRSIQVTGTPGAAGELTIQGSNDGTNYAALHDVAGNALTFSAAGIKQVLEVTKFIRPAITAGENGVTNLAVSMYAGKKHR